MKKCSVRIQNTKNKVQKPSDKVHKASGIVQTFKNQDIQSYQHPEKFFKDFISLAKINIYCSGKPEPG
jgi:hypothetical protein